MPTSLPTPKVSISNLSIIPGCLMMSGAMFRLVLDFQNSRQCLLMVSRERRKKRLERIVILVAEIMLSAAPIELQKCILAF